MLDKQHLQSAGSAIFDFLGGEKKRLLGEFCSPLGYYWPHCLLLRGQVRLTEGHMCASILSQQCALCVPLIVCMHLGGRRLMHAAHAHSINGCTCWASAVSFIITGFPQQCSGLTSTSQLCLVCAAS